MSKNILVVTGSPKKGGNSEALADAIIDGSRQAGNTVTKYTTGDKKIAGCRDCKQCFSKGKPCVFDDDFNDFAALVEESDVVVFTTPLYWYTFPAQIKAAIDRLFSLMMGNRLTSEKGIALAVCSGDPDPGVFEGIVPTYKRIAKALNWKDAGILTAPGFSKDGGIEKLRQAREFGAGL